MERQAREDEALLRMERQVGRERRPGGLAAVWNPPRRTRRGAGARPLEASAQRQRRVRDTRKARARVERPLAVRPQQRRAQGLAALAQTQRRQLFRRERPRRDERRPGLLVRERVHAGLQQALGRDRAPLPQEERQAVLAQIRRGEDGPARVEVDDGLDALARQAEDARQPGGVDFADEFDERVLAQLTFSRKTTPGRKGCPTGRIAQGRGSGRSQESERTH